MSEHQADTANGVDETARKATGQEESNSTVERTQDSGLISPLGCMVILATVLAFGYLAYDRFSYVSIRFPNDSELIEVTISSWWGRKQETVPLRRTEIEGVYRWRYGNADGRLEPIDESTRFASPFIIQFPWGGDSQEDLLETENPE